MHGLPARFLPSKPRRIFLHRLHSWKVHRHSAVKAMQVRSSDFFVDLSNSVKIFSFRFSACPTGYRASALTASKICVACSSGKYQDKSTQTSCLSCLTGRIASSAGSSVCTDCLAGSYANAIFERATLCIPCSSGRFQPSEKQTSCLPCSSGKYTDTALSRICRFV